MVTINTYSDLFKAQLDKTILEDHGIYSEVLDQNINMISGFFNADLLGIRLVVAEEDLEQASKLLKNY